MSSNLLECLENKVCELESSLEVSKQVNKVLKKSIDKNEQYSRRKCLIIDGIVPDRNETIDDLKAKIKNITTNHLNNNNKNNNVHPGAFDNEFDKCHRIGVVKGNKQSVIVKFKSDGFREYLYKSKKSTPRNIRFRVSLTKSRINLFEHANKKIEGIPAIKFAYADANGNPRLLLDNKTRNGSWTLPFEDEDELDDLLLDFHPDEILSTNPPHVQDGRDTQTEEQAENE